jgi:hypothetical protein
VPAPDLLDSQHGLFHPRKMQAWGKRLAASSGFLLGRRTYQDMHGAPASTAGPAGRRTVGYR